MKKNPIFWRAFTLFVSLCSFSHLNGVFLFAGSEPLLEEAQVDQLRSLPYGVAQNPSLILRSRHVYKVKFSGAGSSSKYGFVQNQGIIPEGLWLRFRNAGAETRSSCSIELENVDASKYNSIIIWVRSLEPSQHFILTLQDKGWTDKTQPQGKSSLVQFPRATPRKIFQLVVPFKSFAYKASLDYSRIARIEFEFGRQIAKNTDGEIFEILGVAFVDQKISIGKIFFIDSQKPFEKPKLSQISAPPKAVIPPKPLTQPSPKPVQEPVASPPVVQPKPVLPPIVQKPVEITPSTPLPEVSVPIEITPVVEKVVENVPKAPFHPFKNIPDLNYILASALILLLGGLLLIRRRRYPARVKFGPIFYKLNWSLPGNDLSDSGKTEKKFWRKLGDLKIKHAWISPYQTSIERAPSDEHHGESFLRKQVKSAAKAGVHLVPSLCFVRSLFHFESFLANPQLYLTKTISNSEIHLSDEELRVRYIGYFPVWIPPYWQKQQGLPQKLLLAYGKLPGIMATSDSVQFNLRSLELRKMAIRVIERLARAGARAVRIEGASAMLNSSLNLYWSGAFMGMGQAQDIEFWEEVLRGVKSKFPDFLFISDGAGPFAQKLSELGFDFIENNQLIDIFTNQIRLEEVGSLKSLMIEKSVPLLSRSIYDVSALFRTSHPNTVPRQQNLLCAMTVGFLPGLIEHDGQIPQELAAFYSLISKWPVFQKGKFVRLQTASDVVLAFARWEKKVVFVVIVNFSLVKKSAVVKFDPFVNRIEPQKLYLFSDALHGAQIINDLKRATPLPPAIAVMGQDLIDSGLTLSMSELSLRLFSVNLGQSIQHEIPSEVRQFHKA